MDSKHLTKSDIQCDLCKTGRIKSYCDFCQVNLCTSCIGEHIGDEYHRHKIVPFHERKSTLIYPQCATHGYKTCELKCKQCNQYICTLCVASKDHIGHDFIVLEYVHKAMKQDIKNDAEELQKVIFPKYEELSYELENGIATLGEGYEKLKKEISKLGEKWHREIDSIVNKIHNDAKEIEVNHRYVLQQHLVAIKQIESLIKDSLLTLKTLEDSNVVATVIEYSPENQKYSVLPAKVKIILPSFYPKPIDTDLLLNMFGSVSKLSDLPEVINTFNSRHNFLRCVSLHSEEEIWTSGEDNEIRCFNSGGNSTKAIKTLSGEWPNDITVTNNGDLVYCDWKVCTVNKISDTQIEVLIRLQGWTPTNLFATTSSDLLVVMRSKDNINCQCKVVRYSNDTEKQTIQNDEEGIPLYSGNTKIKFINENRNLDICVSDSGANSVVVVNQSGKLRFRYTGHPPGAKRTFKPFGITTNSRGQILTADDSNKCIHILDKDGQFLLYIDDVNDPYGLCVDRFDMLFVTEYSTGDVKVIKYFE